jgi:hypothetical protein
LGSRATDASRRKLQELTRLQAKRPIKQHIVEDYVLVVDSSAANNRGALAGDIPGEPGERTDIVVGIVDAIALVGKIAWLQGED